MPLPFFDRNQGRISAARHGVARAREELRREQAVLTAELQRAYQALSASQHETRALESEVLPAAESAFDATRQAFEQGKGDYLDVLDAQRTLVAAREQHLNALAALARAAAQVEGMIGQPLATVAEAPAVDKETHDVE
jgi:cobalt-zinc-cadmium efflux system outer membrane protein